MKKIILLFLVLVGLMPCVFGETVYVKTYIQPNHRNTVMMRSAFQEWTKALDNKVVFLLGYNEQAADTKVYFVEKIDKSFNQDRAIGLTKPDFTTGRGIPSMTIYIADRTQDNQYLAQKIIFNTMLHEIGHSLGLGHSDDKKDIMHPTASYDIKITEKDVQKVNIIYLQEYDF